MSTLKVTIRSAYGQDRVYPACDKSRLLAKLAGTTTLTRQHLIYIVALGYTVTFSDTHGHWLGELTMHDRLSPVLERLQ